MRGTTAYQTMNATINAVAKRYRYTGKERDEETGLYYHGARYYAPWLARWCAVDPMQSEMPTWSSYNYGFCNPVVWQDSTGMQPDGDFNNHVINYQEIANQSEYIKHGQEVLIYNSGPIRGSRQSITYGNLLHKFDKGEYAAAGINLIYHATEAPIYGEPLDTSERFGGRTTVLVYTSGSRRPVDLDSFMEGGGSPEDISNFVISINVSTSFESTYEAATVLNHELSIHAVKFADIIAQGGTNTQIVNKLLSERPDVHHLDVKNINSEYNIINKQVLSAFEFGPQYDSNEPMLEIWKPYLEEQSEQYRTGVLSEAPLPVPNKSSYNFYLLELTKRHNDNFGTSGIDLDSIRNDDYNPTPFKYKKIIWPPR